MAPPAK